MMPDKESIREPVAMETLEDLCSESSMDSSEAVGVMQPAGQEDSQQDGTQRPVTPSAIYG